MSVLTIGYSFSMKILHNLFKLDMKRFVIVINLLYVTACLTKLHIIARCIAERLASGWTELKYLPGDYSNTGYYFFGKLLRPGFYSNRPLIKQGPLFECSKFNQAVLLFELFKHSRKIYHCSLPHVRNKVHFMIPGCCTHILPNSMHLYNNELSLHN